MAEPNQTLYKSWCKNKLFQKLRIQFRKILQLCGLPGACVYFFLCTIHSFLSKISVRLQMRSFKAKVSFPYADNELLVYSVAEILTSTDKLQEWVWYMRNFWNQFSRVSLLSVWNQSNKKLKNKLPWWKILSKNWRGKGKTISLQWKKKITKVIPEHFANFFHSICVLWIISGIFATVMGRRYFVDYRKAVSLQD